MAMKLAFLPLFAVFMASAWAQEPPPSSESLPPGWVGLNFVRRPTAVDIANNYPRRAIHQGVNGDVELDCLVRQGGSLNCTVASESPAGFGFGAASLRVAQRFRVSPETSDGRSSVGGRLHIPLRWRLSGSN